MYLGNTQLDGTNYTSWFLDPGFECDEDTFPYNFEGTFRDDDDSIHVASIEYVAAAGITVGCNPPYGDEFCPTSNVTRGAMAAFLVRALNLPATSTDFFTDDDESIFQGNINSIAAAGITLGCNPPTNSQFWPDDPVTRGQMAAFLVRAFALDDPGVGNFFVDDDGSVFEGSIDRLRVAKTLGFEDVCHNSLDAVSDRDFAIEFTAAASILMMHVSRMSEELVMWISPRIGFIDIADRFCTGSSIMPQKVNPDVLELIRGKTARVVGNLQALLVLLKGLPLAYNRDLQEDKPRIFDSFDTVRDCLDMAAPLVEGAELNREAIESRLEHGYLDATTLMEHLILQGTPQRTAHQTVGKLVRMAMDRGLALKDLATKDLQEVDKNLDSGVLEVLGVKSAVAAFTSYGSTAPDQVKSQVKNWKNKLGLG